jgi:hypothetical protein
VSEPKDKGELKKLTVSAIGKEITSGTGAKGNHWSLHELTGVLDASGTALEHQFKTFADLTPLLGKLEEYWVKRDEREHNGRTYVSFLLEPKSSGLGLKVDALTLRVEQLEAQMARLLQGGAPPDSSPAVGPGAGSSPATREEDIPF